MRNVFAGLQLDLRVAVRALRRSPGFTAVAVLTLAIGLGGNAAVYAVARNVFLNPLPFRDSESVVRLRDYTVGPDGSRRAVNTSGRNFAAIRDRGVFDGVAAQRGRSAMLLEGGEPERIQVVDVSEGWMDVLGTQPALGRGFQPSDWERGGAPVVLVSHALWQRRLGGDPAATERSLVVDGMAQTVIGVLPEGFRFPYTADVWAPFHADETDGRAHGLNVLARLHPRETRARAQLAMDRLAADLARSFPDTNGEWGIVVEDARDNFVQGEDRIVVALAIAVALVLLLASVNVVNLLVARLLARQRELGIRAALGAGAAQRTRPVLVETVLLFVAGGAAGLLLLLWTRQWLSILVPRVLRDQLELGTVRFDAGVIGATFAAAVLGGAIFGGVVALRGARIDAGTIVRGRGGAGRDRRTLQRALVLAQLSLALVLLVGAATVLRHVHVLRTTDPGFDTTGLYTARADFAASLEPERRILRAHALLDHMRGVPGIAAAGITTVNPLCCGDWGAAVSIEHRPPPADGSRITVHHRFVTPGLLDAMRIPIDAGRDFDAGDDADGLPVALIDQRMADRYWPDGGALGARIKLGSPEDPTPWRTIVGIVGTVQDAGDYVDTWYLPYAQTAEGALGQLLHVMVRVEGESATALTSVLAAFRRVDPTMPVYATRPMDDIRSENLADESMGLTILLVFAAFGVVLAALGIYGLISYFVSDRAQEIGTRIALGATPSDVMTLVARQAAIWIAAGGALGCAGAIGLGRVLAAVLPDLEPAGPPMLAAAAGLLALVALAATAVPAFRAARTQPMAALRA
jgi:putative ABC transport system permease protein